MRSVFAIPRRRDFCLSRPVRTLCRSGFSHPRTDLIRDETSFLSAKMLGLSTADGFMSVKEGVDDMIKFLANEPSVGLYFVQQHAQSSMPYLLDVKDKVMEKIHEVTLHTEDVEEAIDEVRSMTEIGYPISEEMIKDIKTSLLIISKCQPKRGLIQIPSWGLQTDSSNSNAAVAVGCSDISGHQEDEGNRSYLSDVLSSAKQRAAGFRRLPIILPSNFDRPVQPSSQSPFESGETTQSYAEAEELPVPSIFKNNEKPLNPLTFEGSQDCEALLPLEDYSKFKYEKEAKFEAWLQESEEHCKFDRPGD